MSFLKERSRIFTSKNTLWNPTVLHLGFNHLNCIIFQIEIYFAMSYSVWFLIFVRNFFIKICIKRQYLYSKGTQKSTSPAVEQRDKWNEPVSGTKYRYEVWISTQSLTSLSYSVTHLFLFTRVYNRTVFNTNENIPPIILPAHHINAVHK